MINVNEPERYQAQDKYNKYNQYLKLKMDLENSYIVFFFDNIYIFLISINNIIYMSMF